MSGWFQNSAASEYLIDIYEKVKYTKEDISTPSSRVVHALQHENAEICTHGFRKAVMQSILNDALEEQLGDIGRAERYVRRLKRWAGPNYMQHVIKRCEILGSWKHRDGCFVPDAYLIDANKRAVICYEVEDRHPLNLTSIMKYSNAWWTLEYIYWDLHLIVYDIYGNPRIIAFPYSGFVARNELDRRCGHGRKRD